MISSQQFGDEFRRRHDFEYPDMYFLLGKYIHTKFEDIPEAWVCEIDHHLSKLQEPKKVYKIAQFFGFMVPYFGDVSEHDREVLRDLEERVHLIDVDLHEQIKDGIVLH